MMLKFTDLLKYCGIFVLILLFYQGCKPSKTKKTFSYDPSGYWWQLLSFNTETNAYKPNQTAWINANFKTQNDSVFYDSEHDLRDRFFIKIDSLATDNCLKHLISKASAGDSICALIKTNLFFKQQFNTDVPYFSKGDSVVKINLKIKGILNAQGYKTITENIINNETKEIETFFGSVKDYETARDSLGFFWVERPPGINAAKASYGDVVTLSYEGSFLSGRIVDSSPQNFQINYGTPDQLIKGLNYVISKLKMGQNSKIILPSHLAFGENGSSNGSIPPYTPMLYKIRIIDIKKNVSN